MIKKKIGIGNVTKKDVKEFKEDIVDLSDDNEDENDVKEEQNATATTPITTTTTTITSTTSTSKSGKAATNDDEVEQIKTQIAEKKKNCSEAEGFTIGRTKKAIKKRKRDMAAKAAGNAMKKAKVNDVLEVKEKSYESQNGYVSRS